MVLALRPNIPPPKTQYIGVTSTKYSPPKPPVTVYKAPDHPEGTEFHYLSKWICIVHNIAHPPTYTRCEDPDVCRSPWRQPIYWTGSVTIG